MSLMDDVQRARLAGEDHAYKRIVSGWASSSPWYALILTLVLSDILLMGAAFRVAYWARFELALPLFRLDVEPSLDYYEHLVLIMLPAWVIVFALMGLYQRDNLLGGITEYALVWRGTSFSLLVVILVGFLQPDVLIARGFLLVAWALSFLFIAGGRFLIRRVVYRLRDRGFFVTPTLIVGGNEEGRLLARQVLDWHHSGLKLRAVVSAADGMKLDFGEDVHSGTLDEIDEIVRAYGIREMILATSSLTRDEMLSIFRRYGISDSVNLRLSSGLFEIITTGLQVKELAYVPLVSVEKVRLIGFDRILKQFIDYSIAVPALIILSPILLLIAIAVRISSKGPALHRRRVMGLNGHQFDALKFRTMYENADEILGQDAELRQEFGVNHKLIHDPRVTKLGRVLRRFSIDELPQLLNVIRGEMSVVGPRMISPEEMARYSQWGINLLTIKPGITGLWQVSGRSDVTYEERVKMDMYYIRNWTIWFDIYLLIQTVPAVFRARGAY